MAEKSYCPIVLSLNPEWWERMKAGTKRLEMRKSRPRGNGPYRVLVYCTGNVGVVGEFDCDCFYFFETPDIKANMVVLPEDNGLMRTLESVTGLKKEKLLEYAGEAGKPLWGWHVTRVHEYIAPLSLPEISLKMKRPPQSWCYLKL